MNSHRLQGHKYQGIRWVEDRPRQGQKGAQPICGGQVGKMKNMQSEIAESAEVPAEGWKRDVC